VFNYMTTHSAIRQDLAHYYDLMARLDQQLANRLDELEDDGLTETASWGPGTSPRSGGARDQSQARSGAR
jgi:hypothetical protein